MGKQNLRDDHGKDNELKNMHQGKLCQQQSANTPKNGEEKKTGKNFNLTRQKWVGLGD
jgi:hypothetical protein